MAFTRNSAANNNNAPAADRNKAAGYLNINIVTADGNRKRLGSSGIPLRATHPLEGVILKFCQENPDRVQELVGRIEVSFVEAVQEGQMYDIGL